MNKYKLYPELLPSTTWGVNLRSYLTARQWKGISRYIRSKANGICDVCNNPSEELEAHEVWEFDDINRRQHLKEVKAVCPLCHKAFHYGRSASECKREELAEVLFHICKVNGITLSEARTLIADIRDTWEQRNTYDWQVIADDNYLKELLTKGARYE